MSDDPRLSAIQALIEPILAERQLELVELTCRPQGRQLHLRVLVDRVGGMTIQRCAEANQRIGRALDESGLIEDSYTVEVSSPGLDRPLVSTRDFERAVGDDLSLQLKREDGRLTEVRGMLLAVQPEAVVIKTIAGNLTVPLQQVQKAVKAIRW
jgi:ribosome maturation factor RimP